MPPRSRYFVTADGETVAEATQIRQLHGHIRRCGVRSQCDRTGLTAHAVPAFGYITQGAYPSTLLPGGGPTGRGCVLPPAGMEEARWGDPREDPPGHDLDIPQNQYAVPGFERGANSATLFPGPAGRGISGSAPRTATIWRTVIDLRSMAGCGTPAPHSEPPSYHLGLPTSRARLVKSQHRAPLP